MKILRNGHGPGPEGVSNELLKYATGILSESFAEIINTIFEHIAPEELGKGILVALPKPLGPLTSLHPIVFLNSVRKIVSIITLQHICPKVDAFTGAKVASNKGEAVQTSYAHRECSFQLC